MKTPDSNNKEEIKAFVSFFEKLTNYTGNKQSLKYWHLREKATVFIWKAYQLGMEQVLKEKDIRCIECRRKMVYREYGLEDRDFLKCELEDGHIP